MPPQSDIAATEIEALIMSGDYPLGAHLNESALSARLGIGRAAIREACHALVRVGLVEIVPNQGAFVKRLSLLEITHLFDIRACLGRLAGQQATMSIDGNSLNQLQDLIQEMDEAARERDSERYIGLNLAFHDTLYSVGSNPRLAELDRALGKELRIYRRHGLAFGGGLAVSNREHREIVSSIQQGDWEIAGMQLEKHIRSGKDRFLNAMNMTGQLVLQSDVHNVAASKSKKRA